MTVALRDRSAKRIPLQELASHVRPGCRACADFTAKQSDISVGGVGSAPGMSSVVVRTPEGFEHTGKRRAKALRQAEYRFISAGCRKPLQRITA